MDSKLLRCNKLLLSKALHNHDRNSTIHCESRHLQIEEIPAKNKTLTLPEYKNDSSLQKKCAVCVHFESAPLDLKLIVNAWSDLPKALRLKTAKVVYTK